ncbi:hypothetical protein HAX54_001007 [Datura stramonium]|uniref:Uncharacterized protein n=1 Tax=Datura stramonium TaxID=4076 RepID=A0ABS8T1R2_DATST|nr:hypothetical protein [Datura stramonium]
MRTTVIDNEVPPSKLVELNVGDSLQTVEEIPFADKELRRIKGKSNGERLAVDEGATQGTAKDGGHDLDYGYHFTKDIQHENAQLQVENMALRKYVEKLTQ